MSSRSVPRPGVNSSADQPTFISPWQPPDAAADLQADLHSDEWHDVEVGGQTWRIQVPGPTALGLLAEISESKGGLQVKAINGFMVMHLDRDDMSRMLIRMTDPDDSFGDKEFMELFRKVVTAGTARPFVRFSLSPAQRRLLGEGSAPSWQRMASRGRSKRS